MPNADASGPRVEVWGQHRVLADFPPSYSWRHDDGRTLEVLNDQGAVVQRFAPGEWSAVGVGIPHAYTEASDDCEHCHPKEPT